jgi:hypothetical protein
MDVPLKINPASDPTKVNPKQARIERIVIWIEVIPKMRFDFIGSHFLAKTICSYAFTKTF